MTRSKGRMTEPSPDDDLILDEEEQVIDTTNEWALHTGKNLPNHSESLRGRGTFIKVGDATNLVIRTKQKAYRLAAWLVTLADTLPDEDPAHEFNDILSAVENS